MVSELSKTQKDRYCMGSLTRVSNNVKLETKSQIVLTREDRKREIGGCVIDLMAL